MNGYIKILIVSFVLLVISIIRETVQPFMNSNPSILEYIHLYAVRYFHYIIYLISSFYLIFFNGVGTSFDIYVYLVVVLGIVVGWYVFDSCWLSYSELLFYNLNLEKVKTTVHPTFHSIFGNFDGYFMLLSGILYVVNVSVLLYYLKSVKFIYKAAYYIVFMFFFIDGIVKGRVRTMYYSTKNKQLLLLKNIHDKYVKVFNIN